MALYIVSRIIFKNIHIQVLGYLYDQYQYSPKALRELRMLGEALEEKVLKPTNLKGSRWVPYMYKAVKVTTHCSNYKTTNLKGSRWVPYMYKAVKVTTHSSNYKTTNLKGSRWVPYMYKAVKVTTHSSNYKTTN